VSSTKGSTTARGLGYTHQRRRAQLLPRAYGTVCPYAGVDPRCPGLMLRGQALDLDHATPRALGGTLAGARITHRGCNRRAGSRLGHALRRARRVVPTSARSRDW